MEEKPNNPNVEARVITEVYRGIAREVISQVFREMMSPPSDTLLADCIRNEIKSLLSDVDRNDPFDEGRPPYRLLLAKLHRLEKAESALYGGQVLYTCTFASDGSGHLTRQSTTGKQTYPLSWYNLNDFSNVIRNYQPLQGLAEDEA